MADHTAALQVTDRVRTGIRKVITHYKQHFEEVDQGERYKWEAIGWYKKHWDIDASDFAAMLEVAFSKTGNLLASGMYYPYKMIIAYAQAEPEEVRSIFKQLHNEDLSLAQRYSAFRESCQRYIDKLKQSDPGREKGLQHYQDLRAVMVYLTFEYPEKYYLFKSRMYTTFRDRVGFVEEKTKQKSIVWKVESYSKLCGIVLDEVKKDAELQSMSKARLNEDCYQDEELHLLAMDIVFYGSAYMEENEFTMEQQQESAVEYWPSLDEYDPHLGKEDWKRFLLEIEIPMHQGVMSVLKAMMSLGGEATCKRMNELFGGGVTRYMSSAVNLGKRAKKFFELPALIDKTDNVERYFGIPYQGRRVQEDGQTNYSYRIRPELMEALREIDLSSISPYASEEEQSMTDVGLNTILYGPPGTGKTYHTVIYAVAIIENRELASVEAEAYNDVLARYNDYKAQGRIEFTTFHQSFGYEEFIEGIRPVVSGDDENSDAGDVQYSVQPGIFKRFCERAERPAAVVTNDYGIGENPSIWKVSLDGTGDNPIRSECLAQGHIRIGWDEYGENITDTTEFTQHGGRVVLNAFINRMQIGDIVLSCYSASTIDAIGVVTGEYEWHNEYPRLKRLRKVNWIVRDIKENILSLNGGTSMTLASVYRMGNVSLTDVYQLIDKHNPTAAAAQPAQKNYVFIIDEINRGNISKIFGELITLIEESKRIGKPEGMTARLPNSQKPFGVPDNVYIIGTMNTADRSIATLDTALRRRFLFREMLPNPQVLVDVMVEDLSISEMLNRMNQRIAVLYDREHTIGHAYFMKLRDNPTVETLAEIFRNNIIPLLQEYFYEDYEKIRLVLGDSLKNDPEEQFITACENDYTALFGSVDIGLDDSNTYEINDKAFGNIESYRSI